MLMKICKVCGKLIPFSEWHENNGKCMECAKEGV